MPVLNCLRGLMDTPRALTTIILGVESLVIYWVIGEMRAQEDATVDIFGKNNSKKIGQNNDRKMEIATNGGKSRCNCSCYPSSWRS